MNQIRPHSGKSPLMFNFPDSEILKQFADVCTVQFGHYKISFKHNTRETCVNNTIFDHEGKPKESSKEIAASSSTSKNGKQQDPLFKELDKLSKTQDFGCLNKWLDLYGERVETKNENRSYINQVPHTLTSNTLTPNIESTLGWTFANVMKASDNAFVGRNAKGPNLGRNLCVKWNYRSTSWERLVNLKESYLEPPNMTTNDGYGQTSLITKVLHTPDFISQAHATKQNYTWYHERKLFQGMIISPRRWTTLAECDVHQMHDMVMGRPERGNQHIHSKTRAECTTWNQSISIKVTSDKDLYATRSYIKQSVGLHNDSYYCKEINLPEKTQSCYMKIPI